MTCTRFISDLHIDHKKILKFAGEYRGGSTVEEHNEWLVEQWNSVVTKRDVTWVLGDVAFTVEGMKYLDRMNGKKVLVLGNHDRFDIGVYQKYFYKIHGFTKHSGFWMSHAPIHPSELRGKPNIHGHTHQNIADISYDDSYIPVCVECCGGVPVSLDLIRSGEYCILNLHEFARKPL